ncbi:unnamed protein product [Phytomonas sp. EM1]|nr:unnamed protein product [Phytomonas sp. EM1]|eukprot:CCW63911.1 unnamed protein product [Phytomonas sp. isolate EM1]
MNFLIISTKRLSISPLLHKLVFFIIIFSSLAFGASVANPEPSVGGVLKSPSADLSVSSAEKFSNVYFDQLAVLNNTSWNTLGNQTKFLDKCLGKPIASLKIGENKPIGESSASDPVGVHAPPCINFIHANSRKRTAVLRSSSVIIMKKKSHIANNEALQAHTTVASKDVVEQAQAQKNFIFCSSINNDIEETGQSILRNSVIETPQLCPITHPNANIKHSLKKKDDKFPMNYEVQHNNKQYGLPTAPIDDGIENIIVSNEYRTVIPVTLYGTGTTIVSFKAHKDHTVNVVLQLRGHRYDPVVSEYNCENTRISAQLRSVSSSDYAVNWTAPPQFPTAMAKNSDPHIFRALDNTPADHNRIRDSVKDMLDYSKGKDNSTKVYQFEESIDNFDDFYEERPNGLWSSFAQLLDTSLLCEILPSLSLRIPKVEEEENFNFIIQSKVQSTKWHNYVDNDGSWDQSNICSIQVYISQTPAKQLKISQIIFAVLIPLFVLFVPLPFFLRRADIIQVASLSIDVVDCIWYPPYLLRRIIITGTIHFKAALQTAWHQRKLRSHQKRLELQQRALSERMNAALAGVQSGTCRRDARQRKGVDIPLGLPIQPQQEVIASFPSILAAPEVTATVNGMFPNEGGKKDPPVAFVDQTMRKSDDDSRDMLSSPMTTVEPATTAVAVKPISHFTTEKVTPSRLQLEYDDVAGAGDDRPTAASLRKRGIVDGTPAEHASTVSCTSGDNGPTSQELLFPTGPCSEGEGGDVEEEGRFCRICRDGEEDEALVAPCNCTGSVRWVHLSCLDHWRLESIKRNISNYNTCEICKSPFKIKVRRSILIWQSCKRIVYAIILIITCALCFMMIPLISHSIFGEASCVAEYHRVPYATMYQFDGIMLSLFVYIEIVLSVIFARLIVYSWFRSNPEVETYIAEIHVIPRFMTWRNVLKIALVTIVIIAQAISIGYLVKYFMYVTSDIAWNWEASPLLGGIVFVLFAFLTIGVSVSIREHRIQAQIRPQQAAAGDLVVENVNANSSPRVSPEVEGTRAMETRIDFELNSASLGEGATNGNQGGSSNPPL